MILLLLFIIFVTALLVIHSYLLVSIIQELRGNGKSPLVTLYTKAKEVVTPSVPVGAVRRPSVTQINLHNEPLAVREAKDAMKETLDHVPDLIKAKEYLKEHPEIL